MRRGRIGLICTPGQALTHPPGTPWCADNGCFGKRYVGDDVWLRWLARKADLADTCRFAVAPDVVGDASATLTRSLPFLPKIRALGFPAAFVAQDGLESLRVPWDEFDALFIGGSTAWKLGPHPRMLIPDALARGKWVHMGRVNSQRRFAYAEMLRCDSVDGTYLVFGPDVNLPHVLRWSESLFSLLPPE